MSPSPGDALRRLVELEEGDDAARVALLVAEVGVVAERRLEVERVLDEPQAHDPAPEVHVGHDVARDPGEVVRSLEWLLHASPPRAQLAAQKFAQSILRVNTCGRMTLTAPRTIAGQVAERLKAEILAGERPAGTKLRQVEIARSYGVSTTPVREALATLQREGLVRTHPQRGAVVFLPTVDDLRHHYEIRAALEALAAAKAAERFEAAWAPPLEAMLDEMRDDVPAATLHRAQPALPHDPVRALRPHAAGGDDRRPARRVERLPAHLPRRRRTSPPPGSTPSTARSSRACLERDPRARRRGHARASGEHGRARRVQAMKRSTERILTTHVGSLPRPDDLIRTMFAKQEGVPVDPVALEVAHPRRGRRDRRASRSTPASTSSPTAR